jgi:hypothetical protein
MISTRSFSLQALRRKFERGIFAVLQLQREFVWTKQKACQLLDSIFKGYPIGSAMVWRTSPKNEHLLRKTLHILPPFNESNREIWFLIDGQQRLSVLWQVLRGDGHSVANSRRETIDFGRIYFDTDAETFLYRIGPAPDTAVPVVYLLSPRWRSRLSHLGTRRLQRVGRCRRQLLDYRVWLTFLDDTPLEYVRESFVRVNSLGTPIGTADRAFARAARMDLRGLVRETKQPLPAGFDSMSDESILTTAAMVLGQTDIGGRAIDALVEKVDADDGAAATLRRQWPRIRTALGLAIDHLRTNFGVANHGFLPSPYVVAILAVFFYHNELRRPSSAASGEIRRWFWATVVGSRYAGRGFRPNLTGDAKFMARLATNGRARFILQERVPLYVVQRADYSRPSMLTDGYFCLLRLQRPRYLEDAQPIPEDLIASRANRHDKHHIFPRQQLVNVGIRRSDYNSIANICFLVARENQMIGSRQPRRYLQDVPRSGRVRARALRSQLIPDSDDAGLWDANLKRAFRTFVKARTRLIARAFEAAAGARLFARE